MDLPASRVGDIPRKNRSFPDPMTYYHVHYLGLTREELRVRDPQLYACLGRHQLLGLIPETIRGKLPDPLAADRKAAPGRSPRKAPSRREPMTEYQEDYAGWTRSELSAKAPHLYTRLC